MDGITTPKIRDNKKKVSNSSPRGANKISSIKSAVPLAAASAPPARPNVAPAMVAPVILRSKRPPFIRIMAAKVVPINKSIHSPTF